MNRLASFLISRRVAVLLLFLGLSGVFGVSVRHLGFSFSIQPLLEANSEARQEVDRYLEELPPEDYDQLCVVTKPEPLMAKDLEEIEAFSARLQDFGDVGAVSSLASLEVVDARGMIPKIVPFKTLLAGRSALETAREHPLLLNRFISEDGCSATILVNAATRDEDKDISFLETLEERVPKLLGDGWRVRFIGDEVARRAMISHMKSDLNKSLTFQLLFFALLLPIIFRSVRGIVIPLVIIGVAELFCLGALAYFGMNIGLIDLAVPGIIMMIGVCDAVHMIQRFEESMNSGLDKFAAIRDMLKHVGFACFQTSVTTAIGFLSLAAARHEVVRDFGLKAALAVMITFSIVLLLLPVLLAFWPAKRAIIPRVPGLKLSKLGRAKPVYVLSALIAFVCIFGISRMEIDSHWLEELPSDEPIVQDLLWFESQFGGIMILDVRVDGDLTKIENLQAIAQLERAMIADGHVEHSESIVDWIAEIVGNPQELNANHYQRAIAFMRLAGSKFPSHIVRRDFAAGRIVFHTKDDGTQQFFKNRERIRELAKDLPVGLHVEVAGFMEMAHESSRLIATTMLESFGLSLLAISFLIGLIYRSWRIGLAAVIPNVMPIAIALAVNGYFDIPLRIGIVMIYSLGLGLAVDDSIHLTSRFLEEKKKNPNTKLAMAAALSSSGTALLTTSIILTIGTICYLPSGFRSLHDVGVLLTTIVVTALAFDIFLLPHLLDLATRTKKDSDAEG